MAVIVAASGAVARLAVEHVGADPPCRVRADIAADAGIGRPRVETVRRPAERRVGAAEDPAADLGVEVGGQHPGKLHTVVVPVIVEIDPVGQRPVGEIVGVRVEFVQITERPQGAPRLDPQPAGQTGAGQRADPGFLDIEFGRFAGMRPEAEGECALEFVVDIARQGDFGVSEAQALRAALAVMADPEAGDFRHVRGKVRDPPVEHDADRGVEGVVRGRDLPLRRRRGRRGSGGRRLDIGEPLLERADALFVFGLERLDFGRQIGGAGRRFVLRPRLRRGERKRRGNRKPRAYRNGSHRFLRCETVMQKRARTSAPGGGRARRERSGARRRSYRRRSGRACACDGGNGGRDALRPGRIARRAERRGDIGPGRVRQLAGLAGPGVGMSGMGMIRVGMIRVEMPQVEMIVVVPDPVLPDMQLPQNEAQRSEPRHPPARKRRAARLRARPGDGERHHRPKSCAVSRLCQPGDAARTHAGRGVSGRSAPGLAPRLEGARRLSRGGGAADAHGKGRTGRCRRTPRAQARARRGSTPCG